MRWFDRIESLVRAMNGRTDVESSEVGGVVFYKSRLEKPGGRTREMILIFVEIGFGVLSLVLHWSLLLPIMVAGAIVTQVVGWNRKTEAELAVTDRGISNSGFFGFGYEPIRSLAWRDIIRLEYKRGQRSEDESSPSGVWAICPGVSTCVLPYVSEEQGRAVVLDIYQRFPDLSTAKDVGYQGLLREDLISLNLSGRD